MRAIILIAVVAVLAGFVFLPIALSSTSSSAVAGAKAGAAIGMRR